VCRRVQLGDQAVDVVAVVHVRMLRGHAAGRKTAALPPAGGTILAGRTEP
jgi:hypothetical protein